MNTGPEMTVLIMLPTKHGAEVDGDMAFKPKQRVKFLVKIVSTSDENHSKRYEGLKLSGLRS